MLDLFCGRLGWSKAFLARGWECWGFDLVEPPELPAGFKFVRRDVMDLTSSMLGLADFICASSPCQEFSTLRNFQQPTPYPVRGIELFNHTRAICEDSGIPYVLENVAGAMRFVGRAENHCGPFYLWGNAVPPILPQGIRKGLTQLVMGCRETKGQQNWNIRPGGKLSRNDAGLVATIPPELANCVADYAERLLEQRSGVPGRDPIETRSRDAL